MGRERQLRPPSSIFITASIFFICLHHARAQYAKSAYFMDTASDCRYSGSGYLLIRSDEVVNINSRKPTSSNSDVQSCTLRFNPEDDRDIIDVSFTHLMISDDDVTLRVDLTGAGSYTLSAGSSTPAKMQSTNGIATISLSRLSLDDRDYSFGIVIRVYKEDDNQTADDEKPLGVGLVVGIVAGIIVFLIFLAILAVCCYRKKKEQYRSRGMDEHKVDLTSSSSSSPPRKFGLDNATHNGNYLPRQEESPPTVRKQPLNSQTRPSRYDDPSDSESDSREDEARMSNGRPSRGGAVRYEDEREDEINRRKPDQQGLRRNYEPQGLRRNPEVRNEGRPEVRNEGRPEGRNEGRPEGRNEGRPEGRNEGRPEGRNEGRPEGRNEGRANQSDREASQAQSRIAFPPKSPIITALQSNLRFRASLHAAEQEAEERARRINGEVHDTANDSDASYTETWNTTFDTNFDDDPRPPAGSFIKPPTLPTVPMSPRTPEKQEHTASILRVPRPSSSSSEIENLQSGDAAKARVFTNPEGKGPSSSSEVVPIRVQDPHSPSTKRKAQPQHTLRPDRNKNVGSFHETPLKNSDNSQTSESPRPKSRSQKSTPSKPKPKPKPEKSNENRKPKAKKPTESRKHEEDEDENPSRREAKNKVKEERGEYEGRFKKSDSVRKSKSKSPRIGRSRSTGTGLEDTDSIGQPSTPRGYRAVPRVTADDYEDSDVESNYNPLRRTGSKNSLYASRSSLYSRRRRKNSAGESVYSFVQDDMDHRDRDRDSLRSHRLSRRDRPFRSLGDLEMELRDQTQTGSGFANVTPGNKRVAKKSKPSSVSSSHTQSSRTKSRNLDSSSSSSGVARPRERRNSASSATGRSKSRDRASSASSRSAGKTKQKKSDRQTGEEERRRQEKPKPKAKPRKVETSSSGHRSYDDDLESIRTGMTGPVDHSSAVGGMQPQPGGYFPPQGYPPVVAGYPPHMAYMQATGQPMMMAYPPVVGGGVPQQHPASVMANPGPQHSAAVVSNPAPHAPPPNVVLGASATAAKPSKWDMLCKMTGGESVNEGDLNDSASLAGSVFSNPYAGHQALPGSSSAMSDYAASEQSVPTMPHASRSQAFSRAGSKKTAWEALKEMTDQESQYAPSESNV